MSAKFSATGIRRWPTFTALREKKQPFNLFMLWGKRADLAQSLVDRLSTQHLNVSKEQLLDISYYEFMADALYPKFRQRMLATLSSQLLSPGQAPPDACVDLLAALKAQATSIVALSSAVSDSVQWKDGYDFLNKFFKEFAQASEKVGGISVFWFLLFNTEAAETDAVLAQKFSINRDTTPPLNQVRLNDIDKWLHDYVVEDQALREELLENYFPDVYSAAGATITMRKAQMQIGDFINLYNNRRKDNNQKLLKLLP